MTYPEYNKRIGGVIKDLQTGAHGAVMVALAVDALTMIKQRVQETGKKADGTKYKGYSTKDMLIGAKSARTKEVENLLFGSKKKRAAMDWVTLGGNRYSQYLSESAGNNSGIVRLAILKGGYKKLRQLWGLQTDHVDFSVTNDMWNDINVISKQTEHQKGIAIIGAKQEIEKKKLAGNTKRKGDILDLSNSEINKLKEQYNLNVLQIFRNNGL